MTQIKIPDLGGADGAQVIEVLVALGDTVVEDQPLVTLEGDKATMEVPASAAGQVTAINLSVGDTVKTGDLCVELAATTNAPAVSSTELEVLVPDLGGASDVAVIEVLVAVGDQVEEDQPLITLEGDKATMEVPSPYSGEVAAILPEVGSKISQGALVAKLIAQAGTTPVVEQEKTPEVVSNNKPADVKPEISSVLQAPSNELVYASPSVRRYAAYYGVDLSRVKGSGSNARILKEDVTAAIISLVAQAQSGELTSKPEKPSLDMAKLGEVHEQSLSKIKQVSGKFLTNSWQNIPHVTQQDTADITDLELLRSDLKAKGTKVSPLIFMMKAVAKVLQEHPSFNASLSDDGSKLYLKQDINIGVAVDTPKGLVVPVIRNVDTKSLTELTAEVVAIADKARTKGLTPAEMQGGGFTISSLGGIGGGHFTPIVNMPEVAILGVSKLSVSPVWIDNEWQPRKCLPLSLSYDHRVIDGAEGARFITDLVTCLQNPQQACFMVETGE